MMVTHWSHHVTRIDASHSDEGCKMLLLLHAARVHVYEHTAHRHVGIDWMNAYAHLCANKAAAACSLHHCAMHLCVSRDVTNGSPSHTATYFYLNYTYTAQLSYCSTNHSIVIIMQF